MSASTLLEQVEEYIALRRGLGLSMATTAPMLRQFACFAERAGHHGPLTVDLAMQWAVSAESRGPTVTARHIGALRGFARHRAALDAATEVPPHGLLRSLEVRNAPHIYSDAEIAALLAAASLHLSPRGGVRPLAYRTLFALLVSTGLRISEARGLSCRDVDLREGVLTILKGKNGKARVVPLHPTAIDPLREYASRRDASRAVRRSDSFFRSERAASMGCSAALKVFASLRRRLNWTAAGRARRPRIHDLRHTFAVRRLLRWCEEGVDVHRKIAALSTYLGHCEIKDTYWYLSAVPELMAYAGGRFERFALPGEGRAT